MEARVGEDPLVVLQDESDNEHSQRVELAVEYVLLVRGVGYQADLVGDVANRYTDPIVVDERRCQLRRAHDDVSGDVPGLSLGGDVLVVGCERPTDP